MDERMVFSVFRPGKGTINKEEIKELLQKYGLPVSDVTIEINYSDKRSRTEAVCWWRIDKQ